MGRYGTREDEVDRPAARRRPRRPAARRSASRCARRSRATRSRRWRRSTGSTREIDLRDAGSSIVAFEQWLELGEGERPAADHLDRIERYNRDDVVSNRAAARLARERCASSSPTRPARTCRGPAPRDRARRQTSTEAQARVQALAERLADPAIVPTDPAERTPEQHGRWLLAQLLGWHRREDKADVVGVLPPDGARRRSSSIEENAPLGGLEPIGPVDEPAKGKQIWRYAFPDQEFDLGRRRPLRPGAGAGRPRRQPVRRGTSASSSRIDPAGLTVDIRRAVDEPHPEARRAARLDPDRATTRRRCSSSASGSPTTASTPTGRIALARDLLIGRPPRVGQAPGEPAASQPGETDLEARATPGPPTRRDHARRSRARPARARPTPAPG